jgi:sterol O-acyltransferase
MIMKMHSYMTVNGHLQYLSVQSQNLLGELRLATSDVGGWDQALTDAQSHRAATDALTRFTTPTPSGTPDILEGASTSYVDPPTALALRKRLAAVSKETSGTMNSTTSTSTNGADTPLYYPRVDDHLPTPVDSHPLVDHPDHNISELARDYSELQSELTSPGPHYVTWPNNISLKNFVVYQLIPTLVYELEYPRTDRIRPLYLFEKTVATFGTFALLYTVTESFILPLTPTSDQSFFRSLLDLALPFMIAYLLLFYIIFECICNGFAELSYFADRQFYEDWWNSTSWDEFSRKWNKPVHTFLLRHVYAPTMASFNLSRSTAMFITFLLSACAHELVMAVVTQKFRMYLFLLQVRIHPRDIQFILYLTLHLSLSKSH